MGNEISFLILILNYLPYENCKSCLNEISNVDICDSTYSREDKKVFYYCLKACYNTFEN